MQVAAALGIIWDDAEELVRLARISDPKRRIDTAGLSPSATELANRLADDIARLAEPDLRAIIEILDRSAGPATRSKKNGP